MKKNMIIQLGMLLFILCNPGFVLADPLSITVGPFVKYISPHSAELAWQSNQSATATIEIRKNEKIMDTFQVSPTLPVSKILFQNLEPKTKYSYQITLDNGDAKIPSATYVLDNALNYTKYPLPDLPSSDANQTESQRIVGIARAILQQTQISQGYCLIYGCEDGRLAYELAKQSDLTIIGVDDNPERIQRIRQHFIQNQTYGVRFTFYPVQSLESLPFPDCFANLVISERLQALNPFGSAKEIFRVLRPFGGTACLPSGIKSPLESEKTTWREWLKEVPSPYQWIELDQNSWLQFKRPALAQSGSWTHQYGSPANTSNSGDSLEGVTRTDQLDVQWIGQPGADFGVDRNPRMPSPLFSQGRLFHQGLNRLAAIDAYNGTILWSMEIPDLRRVNMPRDASNWCADEDYLYLAIRDTCWKLNATNGDLLCTFPLPQPELKDRYDWGYVANQDRFVYGSAVKKGSVYTEFFGEESWYDKTAGYGTGKICSDLLFAYDKETGRKVWEYHEGVIINTTIAIGNHQLFFVESRHPSLRELPTGRIESTDLWLDQFLVSLDAKTGAKLWEQNLDIHDGIVVFYLAYIDSALLIASSGNGDYHLYSFDSNHGNQNWHANHPWPKDNHGGHMQHPAVVGQIVYLEPCGYDLKTGKRMTEGMGRHGGCATYAATSNALIYRGDGGRISMWDPQTGSVSSWENLRPSCWLSVIPSGGLVLAPEGGGGCSCGNWLETSIGFAPFRENVQ